MKTTKKFAALGALTMGFSLALLGCENNDKTALKNPEGGMSAPGGVGPNTPRNSADAFKKQQESNPLNSEEYKKAVGGNK